MLNHSNILVITLFILVQIQTRAKTSITDDTSIKRATNARILSSTTLLPSKDQHVNVKQYEKSDPRFFDTVVEQVPSQHGATNKFTFATTPKSFVGAMGAESKQLDRSYDEIKALLAKVLEQIEEIERKSDGGVLYAPASDKDRGFKGKVDRGSLNARAGSFVTVTNQKNKKSKKDNDCKTEQKQKIAGGGGIKWGHWTDWSSCSVSCGKGRQIRWRHCVDNCQEAETEMEEKTCQLPACGPGKLFGVIKI